MNVPIFLMQQQNILNQNMNLHRIRQKEEKQEKIIKEDKKIEKGNDLV